MDDSLMDSVFDDEAASDFSLPAILVTSLMTLVLLNLD